MSSKLEEQDFVKNHTGSVFSYIINLFTTASIDHIVTQTNLYSKHHGRYVDFNKQELLKVIGVMILTGCRPIHDKRGLWFDDRYFCSLSEIVPDKKI